MDDDRKLLEEIRDLLQRQLDLLAREAERGQRADAARVAQYEAARQEQIAQGRFYRWTVACGAVVVLLLLAYVFFFLVRE